VAERSPWRPLARRDRVRLTLAPGQQARWTAAVAIVTGLLIIAGVAVARPTLVVAAGLLALAGVVYGRRVGVELAPTTLTVFGPSLRGRTLWGRTVRWTTVVDIQTTGTGEIWLSLPGEPTLVVRAPRGRWMGRDDGFDEKVRFLVTWWQVHCAAALRESTSTSFERVLAVYEGREWVAPPRAAGVADRDRPPETGPSWWEGGRWDDPAGSVGGRPGAAGQRVGDAEPDAPATGRFPLGLLVAVVALAFAVGYLLLGRDLIVVAIALVVLVRFGRDPGRPLALGAFLLLVASAVSTIVQGAGEEGVTLSYATRRTVAAQSGAVIGVLLVVATIAFAVSERSPQRAPARQGGMEVDRAHLGAFRRVLLPWLRAALPYAAIAAGGAAVRLVGAPLALPLRYEPLLDNLRLGTGYSMATPSGGTPVGDIPPLAPLLVAYSPLGARVALLLVSTVTVVAVGRLVHRREGRAAGIMAAAFAALLPGMWGEQLPIQLAGLFVLGGVALADPIQLTTRRAAIAGASLGLATLARPDAGLALLVVAVWITQSREPGRAKYRGALLVSAVLVVLPWATYIWQEFGSPWLTSSLPATLNDPLAASRAPGTIKVAVSAAFVAAFVLAGARLWHRRAVLLPYLVLPLVGVVLALTEPLRRDPFGWTAPLAAVVLGMWAAQVVRAQLGPVLEVPYHHVVDWDVVLDEERVQRGVGTGPGEDWIPVETAPDEDRLFM
jgi:hypothetical protein